MDPLIEIKTGQEYAKLESVLFGDYFGFCFLKTPFSAAIAFFTAKTEQKDMV